MRTAGDCYPRLYAGELVAKTLPVNSNEPVSSFRIDACVRVAGHAAACPGPALVEGARRSRFGICADPYDGMAYCIHADARRVSNGSTDDRDRRPVGSSLLVPALAEHRHFPIFGLVLAFQCRFIRNRRLVMATMITRQSFMHAAFLSGLLILAVWLPQPLYLLSLAVFGLPHVIWEMGFLRSRYAACWSKRWWYALGAVLLAQAGVRGAVWLGSYPAGLSQIIDLFALMLLALMVG